MKKALPAWHAGNVSALAIPKMVRRTYMEHCAMRELFAGIQPPTIVEFGCGYGRLLSVALEFTDRVTGLEREPQMVAAAREMFPEAQILEQPDLGKVPLQDRSVDLAYSFTVLQHMQDHEASAAIAEMRRVASDHVLIVEETDGTYRRRWSENAVHFTIGRTLDWYAGQMDGWRLIDVRQRPNEPGYMYKGRPKPYSGHYMLFQRGG